MFSKKNHVRYTPKPIEKTNFNKELSLAFGIGSYQLSNFKDCKYKVISSLEQDIVNKPNTVTIRRETANPPFPAIGKRLK
tara:strand:+ start:2579 stop:2818 length:240 start_codon:yes stop_codon:yes gene_type:complete